MTELDIAVKPSGGARLWWFTLIVCTAVGLALTYLLRLRWSPSVADPVAQAFALTLSFAIGWPWLKQRGVYLRFPAFMTLVASIAFLITVLRITYPLD